MVCKNCENKLNEDDKFCQKCGTRVNDKKNKKLWEKLIIASIIIFIVTIILKFTINNNNLFYILNIPYYFSMILFIVSFLYGGYKMKKENLKWPIWYTILFVLILTGVVIFIFRTISSKNVDKKYNELYTYSAIPNVIGMKLGDAEKELNNKKITYEIENTKKVVAITPYTFESSNYNEIKAIINNRLKLMGVTNYVINLNESTGEIKLELDEIKNLDTILADLIATRKI